MKIIKLNAVVAGMLSAGALLAVAPGVSSAAFEDGLDMHGWRIEQAQVAAVDSPYIGTSLRVDANGEPGFTDPRPGQNDLESGDGTMGFADPRPGQGDY